MEQKLNAYFESLLAGNKIPGCGLKVRKNGELIYDKCFGLYNVEQQKPVTENTVFRMASMTKLIVAVAVMKLVEDGKLSLNDNLVKFFPNYPEEKKRVRIRHLLNHSSSLGQSQASTIFVMQRLGFFESLEERLEKWADMPFDAELGETAAYSAMVNFELLGRIIEIASGKKLDDYLREAIFAPLGMHHTGFYLPQEAEENLAGVYGCTECGLKQSPKDDPMIMLVTSRPNYTSGSAGLYSTLYDYDRFTTMLAGNGKLDGVQILREETLRLMRTPRQITDAQAQPGCYWGLGFMIFEDALQSDIHVPKNTYGWSGAFGTHMFVHEESGLSATFMISMSDLNGSASYISREIEKIVFDM